MKLVEISKNTKRQKTPKKKYKNKTVETTAGREVPKIRSKCQKVPNIQRSDKKKTKRCQKRSPKSLKKKKEKKSVFRPKQSHQNLVPKSSKNSRNCKNNIFK